MILDRDWEERNHIPAFLFCLRVCWPPFAFLPSNSLFFLLLAQEERTKEKGLSGLIFVGYAAPQK
jgi:hypothetical protein